METFAAARAFCANPDFQRRRQKTLETLETAEIDGPVRDIIHGFNRYPHCFTLQSCYGHFLYDGQPDPRCVAPLPAAGGISRVEYRIAYIALCIDDSEAGRRLFGALAEIPGIAPENIQFGSPEWFWEGQVNSYALQVEPDRFKHQDTAVLDYREALVVEGVRNAFFDAVRGLLESALKCLK